jgi:glycosyltransferase 2 family protein
VKGAKKFWSSLWRIAVGGLLLLWIVHSIFVNEAREQSKRGELIDRATQIDAAQWKQLPRKEQWRLGWTYGPRALWRTLRSVRPLPLTLSVLAVGAAIFLGIARWRVLLAARDFQLNRGRAAEISLVAHFFNSLMLGTVGGDVMKAYYAARETHHRKTEAVVTVLVDRVIGLWAMLVFAAVMILPNWRLYQQPGLRTITAVMLLMMLGASGFVFLAFRGGVSKRWSSARVWLRKLPKGEWLERLLDACRAYGQTPGALVKVFLISLLMNALYVAQFWILARGLNLSVSFLELCLIAPTVVCISAMPVSPSGIGVRENLFVQMLAIPAINVHATSSLSLSLLGLAGSLFWSLVGGVVYMLFKQKHHLGERELGQDDSSSA